MADSPAGPSLRHTAVRSGMWVAFEKWGSRLTTLVVFTILARLLDPADFGLLALASIFVAVMTVFVDQGFGKALIQRENLTPEHCDAAFWTALVLSAALAGVTALLASPIADLLGEQDLASILPWLALSLPLGALGATPTALLIRDFKFRSLAIRRLTATAIGGTAGVACAATGAGVWSLVVQSLVTSAASTTVVWVASAWRPRVSFSRRHQREIWTFGVNVLGIELMGIVNEQGDRLILGVLAGPRALGYYYIGGRIVSIVLETLTAVVAAVSLPVFSRLQGDMDRFRAAFYSCTRISSAIAVPVFAMLAVLAPVLIPLVFGEVWEPAVPVMQFMAALGVINSVAYFDRSALLALDRGRAALGIASGQAVLNILIALITAPIGINAVAAGVTLRQYIFWPVRLWTLRRAMQLDIRRYFAQWGSAVVVAIGVGLVTAAVLFVTQGAAALPRTVAAGLAGAIAYVVCLRVAAPATFAEMAELVPPQLKVLRRRRNVA